MNVKGILKGFDSESYTATIHPVGSLGMVLADIAVARNIPAGEMVAERYVLLHFFDRTNPADCVVVGVYE